MSIALEYPVKMIILIIVVVVAVSLISTFYLSGRTMINDIIPEKDKDGNIVAQKVDVSGVQGTADIEKYCMLCNKVVREYNPGTNAICYIISGTFSPADFPTGTCGRWDCDDWTTRNIVIFYDWRNSQIVVDC